MNWNTHAEVKVTIGVGVKLHNLDRNFTSTISTFIHGPETSFEPGEFLLGGQYERIFRNDHYSGEVALNITHLA